jgi:phosphoenolpyruvate carboxylase
MAGIKIPRAMSTQHPDNINTPFFSDTEILAGEGEVKEAYYVFAQLGMTEQMWDSEGKEVDNQVVEKLLSRYTRYTEFFSKHKLGEEFFLTYRVPNPAVEQEQGKILLETLHSIPRAYDVAKAINDEIPPVFEVILPMCTSAEQIEMVRDYYERIIIGSKNTALGTGNRKLVRDWIGDFQPESINVIPLFEDYDSFLNCSKILEQYIEGKTMEYQRVFLARSDPALNYGSVSAVLLAKIALTRLHELEQKSSVDILPIFGVGSAPFRGNFRPDNVSNCGEEYPSIQTYTVQSSFKYDYPFRDVANAIDILNHGRRRPPRPIDEKRALKFVDKIKKEYQKQIASVADMINSVAPFVPSRRARKLHVGLFGYARSLKGITLPRAIKFCASFHTLGLPPELLGLSALNEHEFDELHTMYIKLDEDLKDAARYVNKANLKYFPKPVTDGVKKVLDWIDYEEDEEHATATTNAMLALQKQDQNTLKDEIKRAAWMRKFLG